MSLEKGISRIGTVSGVVLGFILSFVVSSVGYGAGLFNYFEHKYEEARQTELESFIPQDESLIRVEGESLLDYYLIKATKRDKIIEEMKKENPEC